MTKIVWMGPSLQNRLRTFKKFSSSRDSAASAGSRVGGSRHSQQLMNLQHTNTRNMPRVYIRVTHIRMSYAHQNEFCTCKQDMYIQMGYVSYGVMHTWFYHPPVIVESQTASVCACRDMDELIITVICMCPACYLHSFSGI